MAHEVEKMVYVSNEENSRFVPWHGLGTSVDHCMTSKEAIELAGLDWKVVQKPIYTGENHEIEIPNFKANVRDVDDKVLGIVTDRYQIVQNEEAFDFTDALIGEGCTYETAGSLCGGKRVFLLAKMPETKILGEKYDPFICFTNTHDGTGAIKVVSTPVRVVCQNTLSLALRKAQRAWSTRHMGDLKSKLEEAKHTLQMANQYMEELSTTADMLANTKVDSDQIAKLVEALFPINSVMDSERKINNTKSERDGFISCLLAPDLVKFSGTAYQVVQAASDFATHREPKRNTSTYQEGNFKKVLDGNVIIDTTFLEMMKLTKK